MAWNDRDAHSLYQWQTKYLPFVAQGERVRFVPTKRAGCKDRICKKVTGWGGLILDELGRREILRLVRHGGLAQDEHASPHAQLEGPRGPDRVGVDSGS